MAKETEAVILSAARTPIGKFQGSLSGVPATNLGAVAVKAAVERALVNPDEIEEVIMGNVVQAGEGQAPARQLRPSRAGRRHVTDGCHVTGRRAVTLPRDRIDRRHDGGGKRDRSDRDKRGQDERQATNHRGHPTPVRRPRPPVRRSRRVDCGA